MQDCTADQCAASQVGFWDGSVAVVRLQPSTAPPPPTTATLQGQGTLPAGKSADRALQHDMVLLVHFQVDATALRGVAWCSPEVNRAPPPPTPPTPLAAALSRQDSVLHRSFGIERSCMLPCLLGLLWLAMCACKELARQGAWAAR